MNLKTTYEFASLQDLAAHLREQATEKREQATYHKLPLRSSKALKAEAEGLERAARIVESSTIKPKETP